jgi:hypothetical protein
MSLNGFSFFPIVGSIIWRRTNLHFFVSLNHKIYLIWKFVKNFSAFFKIFSNFVFKEANLLTKTKLFFGVVDQVLKVFDSIIKILINLVCFVRKAVSSILLVCYLLEKSVDLLRSEFVWLCLHFIQKLC